MEDDIIERNIADADALEIELNKNKSQEMKWISCAERLPEFGLWVLVYSKDPLWIGDGDGAHIGVGSHEGGEWLVGDNYRYGTEISYWMPIPPPPK